MLPALTVCSLDDGELPGMRKMIQVFTDASVSGGGVAYVRQHLEQMPEVEPGRTVRSWRMGRGRIWTRHSGTQFDHETAALLLKAHFDEGASQWILRMIELGRGTEAHSSKYPPTDQSPHSARAASA